MAAFLQSLTKRKITGTEKLWAVGPFNPVVFPEKKGSRTRHECLDWLDRQSPNSVIFVSFGTTSSLSNEQSSRTGVWTGKKQAEVRMGDADKGDIFTGEVRKSELPEGLEERVKERGIIVRDWAPQLEILGHPSTAGFMSHCGWNSCIESISMGVPIATWPMHSDQPVNAVFVTKVLRIGTVEHSRECCKKIDGVGRRR
ncbi:UNVERIFIED_CONTAM: Zeatin O-glucosyltransferase [Sesamum angustifolium]|uniref:Zeatin O-glucosyltransferase n=1 Tax=Sesamum angustifolium TaxID=2727405 RepID=A0AAW2MSL3_9LAMI